MKSSFTLDSVLNAELALSLFEESTDAFVIFDLTDWCILEVNPTAQRISKSSRNELVGRLVTDVFEETRLGAMAELLGAAEQTGFFHAREGFGLIRPDGKHVPLNLSVSRVHVEPQPLGLIVARDISDRVRREELQRDRQREMEQASRLSIVRELVAGIVHEIRQPVCAIGNYAEACRQVDQDGAHDDGPSILTLSTRIKEQAQRCSTIIDELQSLTGRADLRRSAIDMNDVIDDLQHLAHSELKRAHCRFVMNRQTPLPRVSGNAAQLEYLLLNLVRNSIEAIASTTATNGRIRITTVEDDGCVVVTIDDNGPGIASEVKTDLFQPFCSSHPDCLGMGLAISRRIAESHFGSIEVAQSGPTGTMLELRLPALDFGRER